MGTKTTARIKIVKNRGGSVSGLSSHTEFRPIIMPGTYRRPGSENIFSPEGLKVILGIEHPKKLPADFWSEDDVLLKYSDTGRKLAMKIIPFKTYERNKKDNKPETPLLLAEFQTPEFDTEDLHPTRNPAHPEYYFNMLSENYDVIKNGDLEVLEIPVINKDAVFVAESRQRPENYWLIPQHQDYLDYLHYKFPERKMKFVVNTKQLEERLINHGTALANGSVSNMCVNLGVLDARTQELIAITRLRLLDPRARNNNVDVQMIDSIKRKIQKYTQQNKAS